MWLCISTKIFLWILKVSTSISPIGCSTSKECQKKQGYFLHQSVHFINVINVLLSVDLSKHHKVRRSSLNSLAINQNVAYSFTFWIIIIINHNYRFKCESCAQSVPKSTNDYGILRIHNYYQKHSLYFDWKWMPTTQAKVNVKLFKWSCHLFANFTNEENPDKRPST